MRGWDDPRLVTLAGLRRRGYTATAVNQFCEDMGVTKKPCCAQLERLEQCQRKELDASAKRVFVVVDPLKVTLTNFAEAAPPMSKSMPVRAA